MREALARVQRNFRALAIGQGCFRVAGLIMAVALARYLGPDGFGVFSSASALVWLTWVGLDAGLGDRFVRAAAQAPGTLRRELARTAGLKAVLGVTVAVLLAAAAVWLHPARPLQLMVGFLLVAFWLDAYSMLLRSIYRVQQRMEAEAQLVAVEGFGRLAVMLGITWTSAEADRLVAVGLGWCVFSLVNLAWTAFVVRRSLEPAGVDGRPVPWRAMLRDGFPLVVVYLLSLVNFKVGVLLVAAIRGADAAGRFGAAVKVIESLLMGPILLSQALFPAGAAVREGASPRLRALWRGVLPLQLGAGLAVSITVFGAAPWVVRALFGPAFTGTAALLQVLGWVMVPFFIKASIERLLCSVHRQGMVIRWYAAGTAIGVLACSLVASHGALWVAGAIVLVETAVSLALLVRFVAVTRTAGTLAEAPRIEPAVQV